MSILDSIKNSIFVPIHPSGLPFIIMFCLITLIIGWIWSPLFFIGLILTLWCIYFFRNPERVIPDNADNSLVIAPADGKIIEIEEITPNEEIGLPKNKYIKIGIFMNVFNVHVNRSPMSGTIAKRNYIDIKNIKGNKSDKRTWIKAISKIPNNWGFNTFIVGTKNDKNNVLNNHKILYKSY